MAQVEEMLSDVLSFFVKDENIKVLSKHGDYTKSDLYLLQSNEFLIHTKLGECNDTVNVALSESGVLLQILEKKLRSSEVHSLKSVQIR